MMLHVAPHAECKSSISASAFNFASSSSFNILGASGTFVGVATAFTVVEDGGDAFGDDTMGAGAGPLMTGIGGKVDASATTVFSSRGAVVATSVDAGTEVVVAGAAWAELST